MTPDHTQLLHLVRAFDRWAATADQSERGWPTDFPEFEATFAAATHAMRSACEVVPSAEIVAAIARVWWMTEEAELMAEEAVAIGVQVVPLLQRLYAAGDSTTRWQVVTILPRIADTGAAGLGLIRLGTQDPDDYVRRRSWLALAEAAPTHARALATEAMTSETDPHVLRVLSEIGERPSVYLALIARLSDTQLEPGLKETEFAAIQRDFGVVFPPDLRQVLAAALPTGPRWPNWREAARDPRGAAAANVRDCLAWPHDGMIFDIKNNAFWDPEWGQRPSSLDAAIEIASRAVRAAPMLIPVYGHRYIPAEPCTAGNPVLSVYQMDIIVYGRDLAAYLVAEATGQSESLVADDRPIRCWTRWMLAEWEELS